MNALIFTDIYDSSIVLDPLARLLFMDLIILGSVDGNGEVRMAVSALARRTGLSVEEVMRGLGVLGQVDPMSRCQWKEGRRVVELEDGEGWKVVAFDMYRKRSVDEGRKAYFRDYSRKRRASKAEKSKPGLAEKLYEQKFGDGEVE